MASPLMISVELPGRQVYARLWEVQVGRVPLYPAGHQRGQKTPPTTAPLTARLYSSDLEVRISQEILLGIGGVRALRLLGYHPDVWHMNEGHSAFLALERMRELVGRRQDLRAGRRNGPPKPTSSPPTPPSRPATTSSRCG